ncbi:MAG: hypothetical protein ACLUFV_12430 [Acutalibacteraceae bacterium]
MRAKAAIERADVCRSWSTRTGRHRGTSIAGLAQRGLAWYPLTNNAVEKDTDSVKKFERTSARRSLYDLRAAAVRLGQTGQRIDRRSSSTPSTSSPAAA